MRPKERIPIFLDKIDWDKLAERWSIDVKLFNSIRSMKGPVRPKIRNYWWKQPDLRFGQMLINIGCLPDIYTIWSDEEYEILAAQGLPKREIMLWGSIYDKDMNLLPKTIWRPIAEMSTEHIQAILDGNWAKNPYYKQVFEEELKLRNQ